MCCMNQLIRSGGRLPGAGLKAARMGPSQFKPHPVFVWRVRKMPLCSMDLSTLVRRKEGAYGPDFPETLGPFSFPSPVPKRNARSGWLSLNLIVIV